MKKDKIGRDQTWRGKVNWRTSAKKGWMSRRQTEKAKFDAMLREHYPHLAD